MWSRRRFGGPGRAPAHEPIRSPAPADATRLRPPISWHTNYFRALSRGAASISHTGKTANHVAAQFDSRSMTAPLRGPRLALTPAKRPTPAYSANFRGCRRNVAPTRAESHGRSVSRNPHCARGFEQSHPKNGRCERIDATHFRAVDHEPVNGVFTRRFRRIVHNGTNHARQDNLLGRSAGNGQIGRGVGVGERPLFGHDDPLGVDGVHQGPHTALAGGHQSGDVARE